MTSTTRAFLLALPCLAACSPEPVRVEVNFPNAAAFVNSEQGRLRIFPLDRDQLGLCPALLEGLPATNFPVPFLYDSDLRNRCEFRAGIDVPEFGGGPHAYVLEMRSSTNDVILTGCTVGEVYSGAGEIRVELYPTAGYAPLLTMPVPGTPESVCGGATP